MPCKIHGSTWRIYSLIQLVLELQYNICPMKNHNLQYKIYSVYIQPLTSFPSNMTQTYSKIQKSENNFEKYCSALIWEVAFTNYSRTAYKLVPLGEVFLCPTR